MAGAALALITHPAAAQATRTWISGLGDDALPCSRTAPCKTLAGALVKTAAGGEIDCLDPLGFGPATLVKSITIDCTGTFGSGTNGLEVKLAKSADVVTIRGVTINGLGSGVSGVRFTQTGALNLEHVTVFGFTQNGIDFEPSADAQLLVSDTSAHDNGGAGVFVKAAAGVSAEAALTRTNAQHNGGFGVLADGKGAIVQIGEMAISGNATGVAVSNGAALQSYGDNQIGGNAKDGTAALTPIALH
jgi:hypothetical protein